jgi:hypothetical protein
MTACVLLTPTGMRLHSLRRYKSGDVKCDASGMGYHDAAVVLGETTEENPATPHDDPRWPKACACGYVFADDDNWQDNCMRLFQRPDGSKAVLRSHRSDGFALRPGDMWDADWNKDVPEWVGPDGRSLNVVTPDGWQWCIDSRASNCDSPCRHCGVPFTSHKQEACSNPGDGQNAWTKGAYQDARPHKCWVRHGEPPNLTVDKAGVTCALDTAPPADYGGRENLGWTE